MKFCDSQVVHVSKRMSVALQLFFRKARRGDFSGKWIKYNYNNNKKNKYNSNNDNNNVFIAQLLHIYVTYMRVHIHTHIHTRARACKHELLITII